MNVVILTPDGVGSSLLQRVLTVHMNASNFDQNVINLHELTNGIERYFSWTFNDYVLGKNFDLGYSQSLENIIESLDSVSHYKTSRLANYHINRRQDSIAEQKKFYDYLNKNFFVIAAQRKNVFEYGLNWGLKSTTGITNAYTHSQKLEQLYKLRNGVTVPKQQFVSHLENYKNYLSWVNLNFNVNSFFIYEDHMPQIDNYINNLDFFSTKNKKSWEEISGVNWQTWNKCHKLLSDAFLASRGDLLLENLSSKNSMPLSTVRDHLPIVEKDFLDKNLKKYTQGINHIEELVSNRILTTNIPIKMQTLVEKRLVTKNFTELVDVYNNWANENNFDAVTYDNLLYQANTELLAWYSNNTVKMLSV